jgi:beta-barrel assembly-enhancing protease
MKKGLGKNLTAMMLLWAMLIVPLAAFGQTRISMPKNRYKIEDDIKIGQQYSREVEQQMPILNDYEATRYVQSVGNRLENAIPPEFRQPQFNCTFKIVNARDINAFALPACYLYVNRGMIEAAQNEGEMAGVMAHEISHAILRHATAQATRQSNPLNQILGIGAILGGAILGGQQGAAIGQTIVSGYFLKYSREYETQADILGSQIMARAGYDPRGLANIFRTIEQQSGGSRAPEWLSSHPNPGNRYNTINREAQLLRVSPEPIKVTQDFIRIKRKLQGLPRAQSMAEIERNGRTQQGRTQTSGGRYESRVESPSSRTRTYTGGNWMSVNIPANWQTVSESQTEVWFAPSGAYGQEGITHGALIGVTPARSRNLSQDTEDYVQGLMQSNNYLRQQSGYSRVSVGGRSGLGTVLSGRSPITGNTEIVTVYTTYLRNGGMFYVITVAPQNESSTYDYAFRTMLRSLRLNA